MVSVTHFMIMIKDQAADFIRHILEQICKDKEAVSVEDKTDDQGIIFFIRVSNEDMGKLIGRGGQNISALRTLVRIMGAREGQRIALKVLDT